MSKDKALSTTHLYLILVVVILIWGLGWPINKMGLNYIPPYWYASGRLVFGTLSMFIIGLCLRKLILPNKQDLPLLLTLGIFQNGLFILFLNLALTNIESGTAAILVYTTPVWVTPIAIFYFKERNSLFKWLGILFGIIGILCMLNPSAIDWSNDQTKMGVFYLLLAAINVSIGILCAKYLKWYHTPLELAPWQLLIGSIILLIVAIIVEPHPVLEWNLTSTLSLAFTSIFATAIAFLGIAYVSKTLPATVSSISFLAVPVCGVIFSALILNEAIQSFKIYAMLFICAGVICMMIGEKKPGHEDNIKQQ